MDYNGYYFRFIQPHPKILRMIASMFYVHEEKRQMASRHLLRTSQQVRDGDRRCVQRGQTDMIFDDPGMKINGASDSTITSCQEICGITPAHCACVTNHLQWSACIHSIRPLAPTAQIRTWIQKMGSNAAVDVPKKRPWHQWTEATVDRCLAWFLVKCQLWCCW